MVGKGEGRANLYIDLDNCFLPDLRGKSPAGRKRGSGEKTGFPSSSPHSRIRAI